MSGIRPGSKIYIPQFDEAFTVTSYLGSGASAAVYKIVDNNQNQFALKSMVVGRNDTLNEVADNELVLLRKLDHPNIVKFYGEARIQGVVHIKMELANDNLRSYLQKKPDRALNGEYFKHLLVHVVHGLKYLHEEGVIHRDIKPYNVLLVGKIWKICDFGVSSKEDLGKTFVGTSPYLAPELLNCMTEENLYTEAVDIWALGVMMFESFFRVHPFCVNPSFQLGMKEYQDFFATLKQFTENGFHIEQVVQMYYQRNRFEDVEYIKRKLKFETESVILEFFKEAFRINPYHRIRPEGIFNLMNKPKRIRIMSQSKHEEQNQGLRVSYSRAASLKMEEGEGIYAEIIFLTATINLMKKLYHDPLIIRGEIGGIEFILNIRSRQSKQEVQYEYECTKELAAYYQMHGRSASASIRNLLLGRMHGLKLNPQPSNEIKELMFRLLICSVWEDLMFNLDTFTYQFKYVLRCREEDYVQALEDFAKSGQIDIGVLYCMELELNQLVAQLPK